MMSPSMMVSFIIEFVFIEGRVKDQHIFEILKRLLYVRKDYFSFFCVFCEEHFIHFISIYCLLSYNLKKLK